MKILYMISVAIGFIPMMIMVWPVSATICGLIILCDLITMNWGHLTVMVIGFCLACFAADSMKKLQDLKAS